MLSVRLLQEGQEGLLGSWYRSVGFVLEVPCLSWGAVLFHW